MLVANNGLHETIGCHVAVDCLTNIFTSTDFIDASKITVCSFGSINLLNKPLSMIHLGLPQSLFSTRISLIQWKKYHWLFFERALLSFGVGQQKYKKP